MSPTTFRFRPTCATLDLSCLGFDSARRTDGRRSWSRRRAFGRLRRHGVGLTRVSRPARARATARRPECTRARRRSPFRPEAWHTPITTDAGACTPVNPVSAHMELPTAQKSSGNSVACTADAWRRPRRPMRSTLCAIGCDAGAQGLCGYAAACIAAEESRSARTADGLPRRLGLGRRARVRLQPPRSARFGTASAQVFYGYTQVPITRTTPVRPAAATRRRRSR
jgi:hypothetical protein